MEVSFEFFPPSTTDGMQKMLQIASELQINKPSFFSMTYGAGGSTQEHTLEAVRLLLQQGHQVTPHISCIGASKQLIDQLLTGYQAQGINQLVCIRGDLPSGTAVSGGDFQHATDLVTYIRQTSKHPWHIRVAAYPEAHPQSKHMTDDLQHFKQKVDAGADSAITQYFYDANSYANLRDDCDKLGINIPIIAGIMPIRNHAKLKRFSDMCGAQIPKWIEQRLIAFADDQDSIRSFGIDVVAQLCEQLIDLNIPGLHFYTLNQLEPTQSIISKLGNKLICTN